MPETKTCNRCGEEKPLTEEFFPKYKRGWHSNCRICDRELGREYYRNNKEKEKIRKQKQSLKYHIENGKKLIEYVKEHKGCADCGDADLPIYCYDFHHIDPKKKKYRVSDRMGIRPWKTLLKEIKKCILLCCNCHRIRTAAERNYYWYLDEED